MNKNTYQDLEKSRFKNKRPHHDILSFLLGSQISVLAELMLQTKLKGHYHKIIVTLPMYAREKLFAFRSTPLFSQKGSNLVMSRLCHVYLLDGCIGGVGVRGGSKRFGGFYRYSVVRCCEHKESLTTVIRLGFAV